MKTQDFELSQDQLKELNGKLKAAKPDERQLIATNYFAECLGAANKQKQDPQMVVQLTDEQLEKYMSGGDDAQKVAREVTKRVQQDHDVPAPEAHKKVMETFESRHSKIEKDRQECKIAAECLRSLWALKQGRGNWEGVRKAFHREAEYLGRDTLFTSREKEEFAMSVGTDTAGGYLSPEIFSTRVYDRLELYGLARQFANIIPMESEILRIPTLDADVTAAVTSEGAQITASDITTGQKVLQPLKQAVLAGPFSDELLINAEPAIIQILQESAGRALAKLEDNHVFIGTSGSYTGLLELTAKVLTLGTGETINDVDFDDIVNLVDTLDDRYVTEEAAFWWNKKVTAVLRKVKNSSNYVWGNMADPREKSIMGYPYHHVVDMTSAPGTSTAFAVFGDLKNVWVGVRGGLRIDLLTEGTVGSTNLGEEAEYALRVIEYMDSEVIDTSAFAVMKRAAS